MWKNSVVMQKFNVTYQEINICYIDCLSFFKFSQIIRSNHHTIFQQNSHPHQKKKIVAMTSWLTVLRVFLWLYKKMVWPKVINCFCFSVHVGHASFVSSLEAENVGAKQNFIKKKKILRLFFSLAAIMFWGYKSKGM